MAINIQAKTDYSTLFSGLNKSSSSSNYVNDLSSLLTDYSLVKSGNYGKLMKAYYSENASEEVSKIASATDKTASDTVKAYNQVSADAGALQDSVTAIADLEDDATEDEIYSAVSSYVKNYNSLLSSAEDTTSTSISGRITSIKGYTSENTKDLASVGITVNSDGTLSLDKDTLASASKDTLDTLFAGTGGYGYSVSVSAAMAASNANYEAARTSLYDSTGAYNTSTGSLLDSLT